MKTVQHLIDEYHGKMQNTKDLLKIADLYREFALQIQELPAAHSPVEKIREEARDILYELNPDE